MNKVIRILIISDFLLYFSGGLLLPILAVFVTGQIIGGTIETVGLATAIYWIVKSVATVPLSRWMDKTDGEHDEFWVMLLGSLAMSLVPIVFIFATLPWHIYALEALAGITNAMAIPGWRILFTNHLDRGKTGYEWSVWDVAVALSTALSAYIGSVVAQEFGFYTLFALMSVVGILGTLLLIPLRTRMRNVTELRRVHKMACDELATLASLDQK